MVVDKEQLEYVSPYSAGGSSSDDMTTGAFEFYLTHATEMMDELDVGLPTTVKAKCTLLLVAHQYECSQGRTGFSSEGIGDYSYSRLGPDQFGNYPLTSFMQQVNEICRTFAGSAGAYQTDAATRCDKETPGAFTLDADDQRSYPVL